LVSDVSVSGSRRYVDLQTTNKSHHPYIDITKCKLKRTVKIDTGTAKYIITECTAVLALR